MAGLIEKALKDLAESNACFENKVRENKAIALLKAAKAELKDEGKTVGTTGKGTGKRKRKAAYEYQSDDDEPPPSPAGAMAAAAALRREKGRKAK